MCQTSHLSSIGNYPSSPSAPHKPQKHGHTHLALLPTMLPPPQQEHVTPSVFSSTFPAIYHSPVWTWLGMALITNICSLSPCVKYQQMCCITGASWSSSLQKNPTLPQWSGSKWNLSQGSWLWAGCVPAHHWSMSRVQGLHCHHWAFT